jgi:2-polyprenyl-6-hydroxyphenyl methylase/3-demethylubiquinone-9 3-methyltransferase
MENINPAEVAKFEALAKQWWDKSGSAKTLHQINPLRLGFIQTHASLQGKRVLDVGCGAGILSEALARAGAKVTGIDASEGMIQAAKLHALSASLSIDYQHSTIETFCDSDPEQFDIITCLELLEHVPDPASIIKACGHLCKPQGQLFFSTLNRTPKAFMQAIIGAEYILKLIPKGTHHYKEFIKPSELQTFGEAEGLTLQHLTGMGYSPFSRKFSLTKDPSVNYLVHMVKEKTNHGA